MNATNGHRDRTSRPMTTASLLILTFLLGVPAVAAPVPAAGLGWSVGQVWHSGPLDAEVAFLDVLDVDADGEKEIVMVLEGNEGFPPAGKGLIQIIDAKTHRMDWAPKAVLGRYDYWRILQADRDAPLEIAAISRDEARTRFHLYDTGDRRETFTSPDLGSGPDGSKILEPAVGDVDGDGNAEVLLWIRATDGVARAELWEADPPARRWQSDPVAWPQGLKIAQLDADPALELLVFTGNDTGTGAIEIYDGMGLGRELRVPLGTHEPARIEDLDGDGRQEILVVDYTVLRCIDGSTGEDRWPNPPWAYGAIELLDRPGGSVRDVVLTDFGLIHIVDGVDGTPVLNLTLSDSARFISTTDLDGDGAPDLLVVIPVENGSLLTWFDMPGGQARWSGSVAHPTGWNPTYFDTRRDGWEIARAAGNATSGGPALVLETYDASTVYASRISVLDAATGRLRWATKPFETAFYFVRSEGFGVMRGASDGPWREGFGVVRGASDGAWAVVAAQQDLDKAQGHVMVWDGMTGERVFQSRDIGAQGVRAVDLDGDGLDEFLAWGGASWTETELREYRVYAPGVTPPADVPSPPGNTGPSNPVAVIGLTIAMVGLLASMLLAATDVGKRGLFLLVLPLYSRLRKDEVLNQETRGIIRGFILANPGEHFTGIRQALRLNNGALSYHLRVLEREGIVKSQRDGLYRRYYPAGEALPDTTYLPPTANRILDQVRRTPGVSQAEMGRQMRLSLQVVNYHVQRLWRMDLLSLQKEGGRSKCFPREDRIRQDAEGRYLVDRPPAAVKEA